VNFAFIIRFNTTNIFYYMLYAKNKIKYLKINYITFIIVNLIKQK